MEFPKQIVILIVKIGAVLLIPYYLLITTNNTSTSVILTGMWGVSQGELFVTGVNPIWVQNQFLFALLFILPIVVFSFFYNEKPVDKKCIRAAEVSVLLSFIITFLTTLLFGSAFILMAPSLVAPSVVSLSIFVFVFWPLLQNSWPSIQGAEVIQKGQRRISKIREFVSKVIPINMATLVWLSIVIFPAVLTITSFVNSETVISINYLISGGLSVISYQYQWFTGGGFYPAISIDLTLILASAIFYDSLLIWSFNLWLGVTTLQYILGKSTIKRVRVLALVSILFFAIPAVIMSTMSLFFGSELISLPLPFYPIIMLLVAKFVHAPTPKEPSSGEMIHVPLITRISSIFERGRSKKESPSDVEIVSEEDTEMTDT
jgi:hypothetical protein